MASGFTDARGRFFPPVGSPESELLAYRDRIINPWSVFRNYHMGRIGLALYYFLGRQWSEIDYTAAFDGVRGAILRETTDEDTGPIVRPVTNIIDPAVEQEVIALVKRQWVPKVTPTSSDPRIKAAAQVANDRLNYRLEQPEIAWREKRHRLGLYFATTGTGLIYTSWDKSYFDLKNVGSPTAVFCPACQTKLYSAEVPIDTLRAGMEMDGGRRPVNHLEAARPVMPGEGETSVEMATLGYCPTCQEPTPLRPYQPTETEAATGVDVFGRPLGEMVPRGGSSLDIDLPFEFYPQNAGAKVTPDTLKRWGRRKVRDLEWIEERYPHLVDQIQPDSVTELLYGDPLLGAWELLGSWSPAFDAGIFDNNANVDEVVELPTFRNPLGRYLVCTKDVVLEDSVLLESAELDDGEGGTETVYVPRAQMSASRYKLRPNEFWGTTIADHEISKQNRLNGLDSQVIETRLRMGSPNLMMPEDMWPDEGPTMDSSYGGGKLIFLKASLANPQFSKPEEIGSTVFPPDGWIPERNAILQDVKASIGPTDVSMGVAKGTGTTSGLQLMIEQDQQSRSLREDELVNSAEKAWSHLLNLEWVLHTDDDLYRVMGPNNAWKYEQYRGSALRGQTEVKIERGSFIAKSIMLREAAREALADKVLVIDSPLARRRMAELYGVDTNINEDTSNQVDHAERMWVNFVDKGIVPVQDMIDDPLIHYLTLGAHLRTEEAERLADAAGWDDVERKIAGWEDELARMIKLEAKSIAFYGDRLTGDDAKEAYAKATVAYQEAQDTYARQQQVIAQMSEIPPAPGASPPVVPPAVPPTPPPPPVDLPQLLQDRILLVWTAMRKKAANGGAAVTPVRPPVDARLRTDPSTYIRMRALVAAYKISMSLAGGGGISPGSGATMIPADKGGGLLPPVPGRVPAVPETGAKPEGG